MKWFLILGFASLVIPACDSSDADGTESHFLEHCAESSECGQLTCIDQRCTRECASDADCSPLGTATYCERDAGASRCARAGDGEAGASTGGSSATTGGARNVGGSGGVGASGTGGVSGAGRGGAAQTGGTTQSGGATEAGGGGATDGGETALAGAVNAPGGAAGAAGSATTELLSCTDPAPRIIAGEDTGFVQCGPKGSAFVEAPQFEAVVLHRTGAVECPNLLPRSDGGECAGNDLSASAEPCAEDADCSARPFGFCSTVPTAHYPSCGCSYGCVSDSDCEAGELCECGDPVGLCRPASCFVDADCGSGNLCASAPLATTSCTFFPAPRGYECQAASDQCLSDADCSAQTGTVCTFSPDTGTRTCERAPAPCP